MRKVAYVLDAENNIVNRILIDDDIPYMPPEDTKLVDAPEEDIGTLGDKFDMKKKLVVKKDV